MHEAISRSCCRVPRRALLLSIFCVALAAAARAEDVAQPDAPPPRVLDPSAPDYQTPRAGEAFHTRLFGRDVDVPARDRRSTSAWDIGSAFWFPWPESGAIRPFGSVYLFRRPDTDQFFRATLALLYNDITYTHSLAEGSPFEAVLGYESFTVPFDQAEYVDGERVDDQELTWGFVKGAVGLGYRHQVQPGFDGMRFVEGVDPQRPDNMFSVSLTFEPKFIYFTEGKDDARDFVVPETTAELTGHLQVRYDALERNLLDLAHSGITIGADASQGWRADWKDWGIDRQEQAGDGRMPRLFSGYAVAAAGVPALNERHRVIGYGYAGIGGNVDRFSAPRLGGGPSGDEFYAISRPLVPGTAIREFFPDHYLVGIAEYRYELFFFTYLSARASFAWLDRDRLSSGETERGDDTLASLGGRLTTGFVWKTRLQLDYNYNFDVVRDNDRRGGNEIVFHISRSF